MREIKQTEAEIFVGVKLKNNYKSCANCYLYNLSPEDRCLFSYPLEKLEESHFIRGRFHHDSFHIPFKPKYGCLGKEYYGSEKHPFEEHIKVSKKLHEFDEKRKGDI